MNEPDTHHDTYVPGYLPHKIGMLIMSLIITAVAVIDLAPNLRRTLFGNRTRAEVIEVIRIDIDETVTRFTNDAEAREAQEDEDISAIYYNRVRFLDPDQGYLTARTPIGRKAKSHYELLDSQGLPETVLVAYLPSSPENIILPAYVGTWFFPGIILVFGIAGIMAALLFISKARTPIEVPNLHSPPGKNLAEEVMDAGEEAETEQKQTNETKSD